MCLGGTPLLPIYDCIILNYQTFLNKAIWFIQYGLAAVPIETIYVMCSQVKAIWFDLAHVT